MRCEEYLECLEYLEYLKCMEYLELRKDKKVIYGC